METDQTLPLQFYSFFTKYSLLDNYGFFSGLRRRVWRKFLPQVATEDTFEFQLAKSSASDPEGLSTDQLLDQLLADEVTKRVIAKDLDQSILALGVRIASYGLDHRLQTAFQRLGLTTLCLENLIDLVNSLSERGNAAVPDLLGCLAEVEDTIVSLRKNKNTIGTSLHLTVVSKRILNFISRTKDLLELRKEIQDKRTWNQLISEYRKFKKEDSSLRHYFGAHVDLLALEVVEHTSQKGEKYVAEDLKEYKKFFTKGLLGGAIIALFALFKIVIDLGGFTKFPLAFLYSINYALCFIIVHYLGGTIATKQPAMTASTITRYIDKNDDLKLGDIQDIILLLRKVSRSQFISLMGNFLMALSLSCLLAYLLQLGVLPNPVSSEKSVYLIKQVSPFTSGAVYYAAIAGVFLAVSGLISGYFDNRVIASGLDYRIQRHPFLERFFAPSTNKKIARFIKKNLGVIAGNTSLGFLLGSAFLLSRILPFSVDIRHIAFSSANVGYAILNETFSSSAIAIALASVLLIGVVNFAVSFSVTFFLALKSRGITASTLGRLARLSLLDFIKSPLPYFMTRN